MNTRNMNFDEIIRFSKEKGFIFTSSEIYGGFAGIYDYGHYGMLLKDNIRSAWINNMLRDREDIVMLDSAIFMHPTTWKASGHIDGFNDPQIDCKSCKSRFRADHILEEFGINADKQTIEFINIQVDALRADKKLVCANCKSIDLTPARVFSLMVKSNLGSPVDTLSEDNVVYLRPETCGGIYLEYKNTFDSLHPSFPFGIAQVGKAFRNEINARQFIFRTREFEQMEMQYFHHPSATVDIFNAWKSFRMKWYAEYGISSDSLKEYKHEKLAHYASDAYDIEYKFESLGGFKEIEGIHARGNFDLTQHAQFSGVKLDYFDETTRERFVPHIVETSAGLARQLFMFLDSALKIETLPDGSERTVMQIDTRLAPIKCAVFPLMKNKPELVDKAREVFDKLKKHMMCEFDTNGNIGKRYRRQDEIGTPFCIVIDYNSLEDNMVSVRSRDTMEQIRVPILDIISYVKNTVE